MLGLKEGLENWFRTPVSIRKSVFFFCGVCSPLSFGVWNSFEFTFLLVVKINFSYSISVENLFVTKLPYCSSQGKWSISVLVFITA